MLARTIIAMLLCGCSGVTTLRYRPSKTPLATATNDHGHTTLATPARGEAIGANLADGFPVWVVHHDDGTITVVSAVAPPRATSSPGPYSRDDLASQVDRSLVSWVPGVRRFYAGGVLYDEHGHALGFADSDGCAGSCPTIQTMPLYLGDLDTFVVTGSSTIEVGKLVKGTPRRRAPNWLTWRRPTPGREEDMRAAFAAAVPRRSLIDALAIADGQYAVVDGDTVRSTHHEPAICHATSCGQCGTERLPLVGIASSDAAHVHADGWWRDPGEYRKSKRAEYVEGEPGSFLVQRQGAGFQLVAGIFRGICSGQW